MKYKIVENYQSYKLEDEVTKLIGDGWEPLGGVSVGRARYGLNDELIFAQSLVKK